MSQEVGNRALYTIQETFVYRVSLFVEFNIQKCIMMGLSEFAGTRKYIKKGDFSNSLIHEIYNENLLDTRIKNLLNK